VDGGLDGVLSSEVGVLETWVFLSFEELVAVCGFEVPVDVGLESSLDAGDGPDVRLSSGVLVCPWRVSQPLPESPFSFSPVEEVAGVFSVCCEVSVPSGVVLGWSPVECSGVSVWVTQTAEGDDGGGSTAETLRRLRSSSASTWRRTGPAEDFRMVQTP
jgi:hypothetical protein